MIYIKPTDVTTTHHLPLTHQLTGSLLKDVFVIVKADVDSTKKFFQWTSFKRYHCVKYARIQVFTDTYFK